MIEEYTAKQTKCDACDIVKEIPLAISGYYDSGWRVIQEKDLCHFCYGMFVFKMIDTLNDLNSLDDLLSTFIENTEIKHHGNILC